MMIGMVESDWHESVMKMHWLERYYGDFRSVGTEDEASGTLVGLYEKEAP